MCDTSRQSETQAYPEGAFPIWKSISVVVPVYGDGAALPELASRLTLVFGAETGVRWELILVNDGSPGDCWKLIQNMAGTLQNVRGINLMRNYGQHNALLCGIRAAKMPVIVTLDDDLQHPPEEIPLLLRELAKGADVVYGSPAHQKHGLWRDMASAMTKLALQSVMGVDVARNVGAFRAFRTKLRHAFDRYENSFVSIDVLLTWATTRFSSVTVRHDARRFGASNYTFRKLLGHALNMITGFSALPLQLASLIGFAFTILGILVLLYVLGRYLIQGGAVPGFPFLASIIALFSGAQLFALGILGEYVARIHSRTMDRPSYVIRQTSCKQEEALTTPAQAEETECD
jgi:glycosyltransferase involved in cell wall biosynthesis